MIARVCFAVVMVGALVAVAPGARGDVEAPAPDTSLEVRGSGAMGSLVRALAEHYMAAHPGITITVQTCGANQGLKALIVGNCSVALGTDEVPEELAELAQARQVKLKKTDVYRDALAVVVNPANPVKSLTTRQLRDIFRGAITNWQAVGGADGPIVVLSPPVTSAAYEVFKRRVLGDEAVMTPRVVTFTGKQLKESGLEASAIAYVGISQVSKLGLHDIAVDGIPPSVETVASGTYPIVRKMAVYQREPSTELGDQFVATFLAADPGQKLIIEAGNVPVK